MERQISGWFPRSRFFCADRFKREIVGKDRFGVSGSGIQCARQTLSPSAMSRAFLMCSTACSYASVWCRRCTPLLTPCRERCLEPTGSSVYFVALKLIRRNVSKQVPSACKVFSIMRFTTKSRNSVFRDCGSGCRNGTILG